MVRPYQYEANDLSLFASVSQTPHKVLPGCLHYIALQTMNQRMNTLLSHDVYTSQTNMYHNTFLLDYWLFRQIRRNIMWYFHHKLTFFLIISNSRFNQVLSVCHFARFGNTWVRKHNLKPSTVFSSWRIREVLVYEA